MRLVILVIALIISIGFMTYDSLTKGDTALSELCDSVYDDSAAYDQCMKNRDREIKNFCRAMTGSSSELEECIEEISNGGELTEDMYYIGTRDDP